MGWLEDYDEAEIKELFKKDGRREGLARALYDEIQTEVITT